MAAATSSWLGEHQARHECSHCRGLERPRSTFLILRFLESHDVTCASPMELVVENVVLVERKESLSMFSRISHSPCSAESVTP